MRIPTRDPSQEVKVKSQGTHFYDPDLGRTLSNIVCDEKIFETGTIFSLTSSSPTKLTFFTSTS